MNNLYVLDCIAFCVIKSLVVLLHPTQDMNHLSVQSILSISFIFPLVIQQPPQLSDYCLGITVLISSNPYRCLMLYHNVCVINLLLSCRHYTISHHHEKGEYKKILRQRPHSHKCRYSLLLELFCSIIVVNLLLCLIY